MEEKINKFIAESGITRTLTSLNIKEIAAEELMITGNLRNNKLSKIDNILLVI